MRGYFRISLSKHSYGLALGVFSFVIISSVQAQDENGFFRPYASIGVSSSQISGDRLSGFDQLGLAAGLGVEVGRNNDWVPSFELLFNQKGSRKNARPDEGDFDSYLLRLNYVELPLLMNYNTNSTGFHLGLAPAYLISLREENQNGEILGLGRKFDSFDLSLLLGIQYAFAERWELVTRFNQSIIPVREHAGNSTFRWNLGQYNSSIQFMLRFHV